MEIRPYGMRATSQNLCRTGDIGVSGTFLQPGFTPAWVYSGSFSMSILPQTWLSHGFLPGPKALDPTDKDSSYLAYEAICELLNR